MIPPSSALNRRWTFLLAGYIAFIGLILLLAYSNALHRLLNIPFYDKLGHFYLIGMLAYLAYRASNRHHWQIEALLLPAGPTIIWGLSLLEEGLQTFSPYRSADVLDFVADTIGILFFIWLDNRQQKRKSNHVT